MKVNMYLLSNHYNDPKHMLTGACGTGQLLVDNHRQAHTQPLPQNTDIRLTTNLTIASLSHRSPPVYDIWRFLNYFA